MILLFLTQRPFSWQSVAEESQVSVEPLPEAGVSSPALSQAQVRFVRVLQIQALQIARNCRSVRSGLMYVYDMYIFYGIMHFHTVHSPLHPTFSPIWCLNWSHICSVSGL
jgi:hypothetical protein